MTELTGIAAQIEAIIGRDATLRLLQARGGTEVSIPIRAAGSVLAAIIGEDATSALSREFGAGKITLPLAHMRGASGRRRRAMQMLRQGASVSQVALACDLHSRTVARYRATMEADFQSNQLHLPFDEEG